jgi:hypothetical protein
MTKKISMVAALALGAMFGLSHCAVDPAAQNSRSEVQQSRPRPEPRPDPRPQPEPRPIPSPKPIDTGDPPPPTL